MHITLGVIPALAVMHQKDHAAWWPLRSCSVMRKSFKQLDSGLRRNDGIQA
jgi:hypothetical protein